MGSHQTDSSVHRKQMEAPMNFEEFFPNEEQLEAHWRDFNKFWESLIEGGTDPHTPGWIVTKDSESKRYRWQSWLADAFIDAHHMLE